MPNTAKDPLSAILSVAIVVTVTVASGGTALAGLYTGLAIIAAGELSAILNPVPKIDEPETAAQGIKQNSIGTIGTKRIIYGRQRVGGQILYRTVTKNINYADGSLVFSDGENQFLHFIIGLCGHEVEDIETVYFDDIALTINQSNFVTNSNFIRSPIQLGINITPKAVRRVSVFNGELSDEISSIFVKNLPKNVTNFLTVGQTFEIDTSFVNFNLQGYGNGARRTYTLTQNVSTDANGNAIFNFSPATRSILIWGWRLKAGIRTPNFPPGRSRRPENIVDYDIADYRAKEAVINLPSEIIQDITNQSYAYVEKYDGTQTEASTSMVQNISEWTQDHKLLGISYIYVRLQANQNIWEKVPNVTAIVKGKKVFDTRTETTGYSTNPALIARDYLLSSQGGDVSSAFIDNTQVMAAANICDERVTLKTEYTISSITRSGSTATVTLDSGTFQDDEIVTIEGADQSEYNGNFTISNVDGLTFDYTVSGTPATPATGTISVYKTQPRYTCNVVLDTGIGVRDNLEKIVSSMAGNIVLTQGYYNINPAVYQTPTITIDESWLAGEVSVTTKRNLDQIYNTVSGIFIDELDNFSVTNFTEVTNQNYVDEDGLIIKKDVDLTNILDQENAQRIAKILLEKSRQSITVNLLLNMKAIQLIADQIIYLTLDSFGWNQKPFRVVNIAIGVEGINVALSEDSSAIYNWDKGEANLIDIAPNTELPLPNFIDPPGNPLITESLYITNLTSGVKTKATVSWAPPLDSFVDKYQIEYRPLGEPEFTLFGITKSNSVEIFDLLSGINYEFRVKAINQLGIGSVYASTITNIVGLTEPPENVENFSLNIVNNNAHLTWSPINDLDVVYGGKFIIKHSPSNSSATWATSNNIAPQINGTQTSVIVPFLSGTYLIKAEDSTGNQSVSATVIIVNNVPNILKMNNISTSIQHPLFTGDKTNLIVLDDSLQLDGVTLFDDGIGDFDDTEGLFDFSGDGGYQELGTYEFDNYIDVGKVVVCRVSSKILSEVFNQDLLFDQQTGFFDDREGLFDGDDVNQINAAIFISTTDDDPAGAPTWSDWKQFYAGDYTARAFKFKIEVTSLDTSYNIKINELQVTVDMPDVVDSGTSTSLTDDDKTIPFSQNFFTTPNIGVTILSGSTGDYLAISNATTDGFDLSVYDSTDTRVARDLNYFAKGY